MSKKLDFIIEELEKFEKKVNKILLFIGEQFVKGDDFGILTQVEYLVSLIKEIDRFINDVDILKKEFYERKNNPDKNNIPFRKFEKFVNCENFKTFKINEVFKCHVNDCYDSARVVVNELIKFTKRKVLFVKEPTEKQKIVLNFVTDSVGKKITLNGQDLVKDSNNTYQYLYIATEYKDMPVYYEELFGQGVTKVPDFAKKAINEMNKIARIIMTDDSFWLLKVPLKFKKDEKPYYKFNDEVFVYGRNKN